MQISEPQLVIDNLYFPECLRWRDGRLWFSDMFAGSVFHASGRPGDTPTQVLQLDDDAGGIGWLPGGDLLVVSMNQRRVLRMHGERTDVHSDLSRHFAHPTNDIYVSDEGRTYVTGFGFDADHGAPVESVQLAVVEVDGSSYVAGSQMVFPNGIDRRKGHPDLVVAETYADALSIVPTDANGRPQPSVRFATLDKGDGPDGISCDDDGGVWVACAFGRRAVHIDARGTIDAEIPIPGRGVFDCLLGGADRRTLYLGVSSPDEEYGRTHRTGSVLSVELS
jgi:sugar lactone lactonase YvrE